MPLALPIGGEYLWGLRYALLLIAAYCLLRAGFNLHRAVVLWRTRNVRLPRDLVEAMRDVKTPRYKLMAAAWLLSGAVFVTGAFVSVA